MDKREILDIIQRMAADNGGTPPGSTAFHSHTGLGEVSWKPHFWLRWGDALKEAGFSPNPFNAKYDEKTLILKFVDLCRELGRVPIEGEIKRKRKADPSFPSQRAFHTFGVKNIRVQKVFDYCKSHEGLEDVLEMCRKVLDSKAPLPKESSEVNIQVGYVYLVRHGSRQEYKIGKTTNPMRREGEIRLLMPELVTPVHTIQTDDPSGIEAYWHKRFATKRKQGEWFALDPTDVKAFKRWKKIH